MAKTLSVGIIGAGPGGLALGIFLRKAGFRDFTIFDREDGVGGTWRINTYPGLACDVKSHLYSYSFDLNANWSRLWSAQPEILQYFERCAQRYRLGPNLKLNTEIVSAQWDADATTWRLTTNNGEQYTFDIVVSAVGLFTQPVLPDLVEEEPFTGTLMHTARWDHSVDLREARVAVLGTGSTASQLVPEVAKVAKKVYSVQRSPTWILPKPDRAYTEREKWLFAHIPFAKKLYRTRLWLRSESNIGVIENGSEKTQEFKGIALRVLESTVADDELRDRLTPDHPFGCKRLVFATDYLQTLTEPHVEVVSSPARYLRSRSLVTEDGSELDVDVVLCATGYAAADYLGQIDVVGEDGAPLRDKWSDGAYAYLGMAVAGLPELLHAVRAQHQRRLQQRHLHARGAGPLHRARNEAHATQAQVLRRGAAGDDGDVHREDRRVDGGHRLADTVQQLLPRRQRPCGDPVAAQRQGVLGDDPPLQGFRLHLRSALAAISRRGGVARGGATGDTSWMSLIGSTPRCTTWR